MFPPLEGQKQSNWKPLPQEVDALSCMWEICDGIGCYCDQHSSESGLEGGFDELGV